MKSAVIKNIIAIVFFIAGWFAHAWLNASNFTNIQYRFVEAARSNNVLEMEKLYKAGAKIDDGAVSDDRAFSTGPAIIAAAEEGHASATEWLLNHGANPKLEYIDVDPLACAGYRLGEVQKTIALIKKFAAK